MRVATDVHEKLLGPVWLVENEKKCWSKQKSRASPCRFFKNGKKAVHYASLEKYGRLHADTDRTWTNFPAPSRREPNWDRAEDSEQSGRQTLHG